MADRTGSLGQQINEVAIQGLGTAGVPAGGVLSVTMVTGLAFNIDSITTGHTDGAGNFFLDRAPVIFKNISATTAGNTTLWTPAAGKRFRLLRFVIEATSNMAMAVAGINTIFLRDAGVNTGLAFDIFMPSAAGTTPGNNYTTGWVDIGPIGYLSTAINNVLQVNLLTAMTGGEVRVTAAGTEE